jgi:osmotically-inducible protein OsmY
MGPIRPVTRGWCLIEGAIQMSSDSEIQAEVLRELQRDPRVEARYVRVEVSGGVVILTGTVTSCAQAAGAQVAAQRAPGVRDVANQLRVAIPDQSIRSDIAILRAVGTTLEWDAEVPDGSIEAAVAGGVVTLHGQVDHEYQRDVAERAIRHLAGVRAVVNQIAVRTPLPPLLRHDVEQAPERRPVSVGLTPTRR